MDGAETKTTVEVVGPDEQLNPENSAVFAATADGLPDRVVDGSDRLSVSSYEDAPGTSRQSEETFDESSPDVELIAVEPPEQPVESEPHLDAEDDIDIREIISCNKKHFFVLSESGKPIYYNHCSENHVSSLVAVILVLVSHAEDNGNGPLNSIQSLDNSVQIHFLHKTPFVLACASTEIDHEPTEHIMLQLRYLHYQIISLLTQTTITRYYDQRCNFDFRRLLVGAEKTFRMIESFTDNDLSSTLCAIRCLPLNPACREQLGSALAQSLQSTKNVLCAILLYNNELVTLARLKNHPLHPTDLHLVANLVLSNPSFKDSETWSPVCLPMFENSGYLHAHISFLSQDCPVALIILSSDRNAFFDLAAVRTRFLDKLNNPSSKSKVKASLSTLQSVVTSPGYSIKDANLPGDMWYFAYKNRSSGQLTSPQLHAPFFADATKRSLLLHVLSVHSFIHDRHGQSLKLCYSVRRRHAVLGWLTGSFELYSVFSPLVSKQGAITCVEKLMKWLRKEEDRLFILNPPLL